MRYLSSLLLCVLILGQVSFASPQIVFSDLEDGYWAKSTIDYLVEKKFLVVILMVVLGQVTILNSMNL